MRLPVISRAEALAQGYTIDDGHGAVAYKGPRFNPDEWRDVPTEREEELLMQLERMRAALRDALDGDVDGAPIDQKSARAAQAWFRAKLGRFLEDENR